MKQPHIPRVRVISPEPDRAGITPAIFMRVLVDGDEWAITDYTIRAKVQDVQMVTLTFLADVTVERPSDEADR